MTFVWTPGLRPGHRSYSAAMALHRRRLVAVFFVPLACTVAACGHPADRDDVSTAGTPDVTAAASTTAPTALTAPTTTPVAPPDVVPTGTEASPVEGLTADELRAVIGATASASVRSAAGPIADRVSAPGGARVWRVRIPGTFVARSARAVITVGGRTVGEGVLAADLRSLTAVTIDGTGLVAGAAVAVVWEGADPVGAGRLVVVR